MEIILFVCVFTLVNLGLLAYANKELGCEADAYQVENFYIDGRRIVFTSELEEKRQRLNRPNSKF